MTRILITVAESATLTNLKIICAGLLLPLLFTLISACGSGGGSSSAAATAETETDSNSESGTGEDDSVDETEDSIGLSGLDITQFEAGALISDITVVSCTLSGGTQTTCYQLEIVGVPTERDIGPFCPPSIFSEADEAGVWFDGSGDIWDVDGDFIINLPNLYGDSNWQLYDVASGEVKVTDTQTSCEAAARPNVAAQYQNHCVECSIDYYGGGVSQTVLIPTTPVPLTSPDGIGQGDVGVALDGVLLAAPAPVAAILRAYTVAAFDDCGGHVNPIDGYHYHASLGCAQKDFESDGHAGLMAVALDGYGIYGMLDSDGNEAVDLDACRGHTDEIRGYHYHAASAAENMFIGCYNGEQGSVE